MANLVNGNWRTGEGLLKDLGPFLGWGEGITDLFPHPLVKALNFQGGAGFWGPLGPKGLPGKGLPILRAGLESSLNWGD